jgi:N-acetylmuramoyl-L-alanine amidase
MRTTKNLPPYFQLNTKVRSKTAKLVFSCFLTAIIVIFMPSSKIPKRKIDQVQTIVLDAGHGGNDPGCNGAGEVWEKEVTLAVVLKVGKFIKDSIPEMRVLYTRQTDKSLKLWERPNFANRNEADLFISVHCNANTNVKAAGSETYFMGLHKNQGNLDVAKRENSAIVFESDYKDNQRYGGFDPNSAEGHIIFSLVQNAFLTQSLRLSTMVEEETGKISQIRSRGVKQAGFLVLWQTSMPSILIETGFLTNNNDRQYLNTDEGKTTVALGIFRAIKNYKNSVEKKH